MKIFRLTVKKVNKWTKKGNVDKLIYALQNGLYDVRKRAAEGLGELEVKNAIPYLIKAIDDKVKIVSFASMNSLERIGIDSEIENMIMIKKEYWETKELEAQKRAKEKLKIPNIYKWERPSKQTLENIREMLKKPMNTGKWF